jgi:hypothetical protein
VGERNGTINLNVSANSVSSSALPMLPLHVHVDSQSSYVGYELADLRTLDELQAEFATPTDQAFLKVDVQGLEHRVLCGAADFLRRLAGVQLELSLVPLYDGERLFRQMLDELETAGLELWGLTPGLVHPVTARLLQVDAVFFKKATDTAVRSEFAECCQRTSS